MKKFHQKLSKGCSISISIHGQTLKFALVCTWECIRRLWHEHCPFQMLKNLQERQYNSERFFWCLIKAELTHSENNSASSLLSENSFFQNSTKSFHNLSKWSPKNFNSSAVRHASPHHNVPQVLLVIFMLPTIKNYFCLAYFLGKQQPMLYPQYTALCVSDTSGLHKAAYQAGLGSKSSIKTATSVKFR